MRVDCWRHLQTHLLPLGRIANLKSMKDQFQMINFYLQATKHANKIFYDISMRYFIKDPQPSKAKFAYSGNLMRFPILDIFHFINTLYFCT